MRDVLDALGLHAALLISGFGALRLTDMRTPLSFGALWRTGGLAYMVGVAVVMQSCILLLVLGVPFGLPTIAAICALLALPLLPDVARRRAVRRPRTTSPTLWAGSLRRNLGDDRLLVVAVLVAFAILALIALATTANMPISAYDAWNLWSRKAELMFDGSHLPIGVLSSTAGGYIHPDYPLILPLLEAAQMRALHRLELSSAHTVLLALMVAFVWAGVHIGSRVNRSYVVAVVFPGVVMLTLDQLLTGYADIPMAFYLGLGTLLMGIWLDDGRHRDLAVTMMLLAGAAGIKNEGMIGAVVVIVSGLIIVGATRRMKQLRDLLVAAVAMGGLSILPWHLWLVAHHLKGDIPFPGGLDPAFLSSRAGRLWPSINALYEQITNIQSISVAVSIAAAVIVLRAVTRRFTRAAAFYLVAGVLYFALLVWAYWVNPLQLQFLILSSADRVYVGLAFMAVAAVIHLGSEQLDASGEAQSQAETEQRKPKRPATASR